MKRIEWIDWAKALAVMTVVFCHLPQSSDMFYFRYLQACIITIFFFISGYLKRDRGSQLANWQKYRHSLIVPYLLLNLLVYPFWLLRFCLLNGTLPDLFDALRPIVGMLLLEHENSFATVLNGPLWYLPAILIMHLLVDCAHRTRHEHALLIGLCLISVGLYAANKYWMFLPQLTPMGIMRRLPYFYLGYVLGLWHRGELRLPFATVLPPYPANVSGLSAAGSQSPAYDALPATTQHPTPNTHHPSPITHHLPTLFIVSIALSLALFYWHIHEPHFLLHIALFYPVNLGFLATVCFACMMLSARPLPSWVLRMSQGTLVVIGFHTILISAANYTVCLLGHTSDIVYSWQSSLLLTAVIVLLLYPVIIVVERHFPRLIGH